MKQVIENAIEYVKDFFSNNESSHDYFHTMRVYENAKHILKYENANRDIVLLASLLHDVDDYKISPNTYKSMENAKTFLRTNNVKEEDITLICEIINDVSFKGSDTKTPNTIEGKIVQDADRLDALGAIGIARALTYGGSKNRVLYDPNILPSLNMQEDEYRNHISTTINHFYEKLFKLKYLMNTDRAKKIAKKRDKYMRKYINKFINEWSGIE